MASQNVIRIDNADDPRLSRYRDLRNRDPSDKGGTFIAEGRLIVDRLIASEYSIDSLLLEDGKANSYATQLASEVPIYCLPREMMELLVGFDFHRGVMACGRRQPYREVRSLSTLVGAPHVALALLGIDDQENMGSILRSAAALGVNQILLGPKTIDPFRRRVIRVSMANVLMHRFYRLRDPVAELRMLRQAGFRTVAATLDEATDLDQFLRDDRPTVLMVGNEARGIDPEVQRIASDRVRIPMQMDADSLNVAVAAAIMMYEFTRPSPKSIR